MKRIFDVVFSFAGIIFLSPFAIAAAILIKLALGGPVFFSQIRPGHGAKPFKMIKFRTMSEERDAVGNLLPDEQRLSGIGRFIRSTSLDELPELFNVLIGDMSLVGPRPLLMEYVPLYTKEQNRRHEVRPGITGWAQINGRNALSWDDKFRLDVWYVDHQSVLLDIKILIITVFKIFKRDGISHEGEVTMPKFTGNDS